MNKKDAHCACCGNVEKFLTFFFLSSVCDKCGAELKKISRKEISSSKHCLVHYIRCQAMFIGKREKFSMPDFLPSLSTKDLNDFAQWFASINRVSLG